jgi:hypothetical protein
MISRFFQLNRVDHCIICMRRVSAEAGMMSTCPWFRRCCRWIWVSCALYNDDNRHDAADDAAACNHQPNCLFRNLNTVKDEPSDPLCLLLLLHIHLHSTSLSCRAAPPCTTKATMLTTACSFSTQLDLWAQFNWAMRQRRRFSGRGVSTGAVAAELQEFL